MSVTDSGSHAALMDGVYRWQRHIYDATRKYYLLGRDRLIESLDVPKGGTVLEVACGTGRNLALAGRRYRDARLFGLDISAEMLETATDTMQRRDLIGRARLAEADATGFDAMRLFGYRAFDRVFISYSLSMIPDWRQAVRAALAATANGGQLHIVDFGRQERLPGWFMSLLRGWLARFHVTPRDDLREVLESECEAIGASLEFDSIFRGYAVIARIRKPR
ncbi:MAG: class I SAM-dependent methyltransferase [Mesorhizobium sp.]